MKLNGAEIVVECLKEQETKYIFGYPGAATINIYDELYKNREYITHVLTAHEQGATHAADGYSRSTGKIGVCLATSGPGSTNLVTGIATAYMDSVPLVAITGNVPMEKLGKDSFQEVDIQGITFPITKHNYMVKDINKLADIMREAFYIAQSGRPGPVLIDIPKNITSEVTDYERQMPRVITKDPECIIPKNIYEMIKKAKRPLVISGGGVIKAGASEQVRIFAEKTGSAVACTLMGIGAIPYEHPLSTGNIGMHGSLVSNRLLNECDLLLVFGGRFSDRVVGDEKRFATEASIIQFDVDPAEINKNIVVDGYVIGDLEIILKIVNAKIELKERKEWREKICNMKEEHGHKVDKETMNVANILKRIGKHCKYTDIIVTDVGQHQMWTAQHYPFNLPNRFLTSGGLGTMGYGIGAAIGAQIANQNDRVVLITGDGSFKMNLNEIITAVRNKLPIKIFIMNNRALGMVRQWQNLFYEDRFSATNLDEDIEYIGFAKSFGAEGFTMDKVEDIDSVIEEAFSSKKVSIINCVVDRENNVYPMVPPGSAVHEAISGPEEL